MIRDGTETQRIGIVSQDLGILKGRNSLLEKAFELIHSNS